MYTFWTKGFDEDQVKEWILNVSVAKPVLDKLVTILKSNLNSSEASMRSKESFDKQSWPYFQANCLGEQRVYNEVINLINNLQSEKNS